ncbi:MAG: hypothetical protein JO253_07830 [Alphaproteobacteria bacterium]|nr:hypothetical protein [Alphaproteobacteria bacterium]
MMDAGGMGASGKHRSLAGFGADDPNRVCAEVVCSWAELQKLLKAIHADDLLKQLKSAADIEKHKYKIIIDYKKGSDEARLRFQANGGPMGCFVDIATMDTHGNCDIMFLKDADQIAQGMRGKKATDLVCKARQYASDNKDCIPIPPDKVGQYVVPGAPATMLA